MHIDIIVCMLRRTLQDTNKPQYRLVQLLKGGSNNLFVVGDTDQAIYGFRGALPELMSEAFQQDYPHAETHFLTNNYRWVETMCQLQSMIASECTSLF